MIGGADMYKVILVDDEQSVIDGLMSLLNWEDYGYEIIATANSGEEAITLVLKHSPDLVVTDMNMDGLNGLELLQMIHQNAGNIKTLVISGYEDFSYARGALQYGAFDYLLKPVKTGELLNALIGISNELGNVNDATSTDDTDEVLAILRSRFLFSLCSGEVKDAMTIENELKRFDLNFDFNRYCVMILDLDFMDIHNDNDTYIKDNVELIRFACANMIESGVGKSRERIVFYNFENRIYVFYGYSIVEGEELKEKHAELQKKISSFIKMPVTTGVSRIHSGVESIAKAYREAEATLKYKLIFGRNTLIYYSDVESFMRNTFEMPVDIEKKIVSAVAYGDLPNIKSMVNELFDNFMEQKARAEDIEAECTTLYQLINHSASEMSIDINEHISREIDKLRASFQHQNITIVMDTLIEGLSDITKSMLNGMSDNYKEIIIQICDFIKSNFHEDISLNKMSERFFISPSYISRLFKEHTNGNFIDYLIQIRISEAKKLLASSNLKIYEISERVGYVNSKYFSQLFFKHVGKTPREYREHISLQ